jgi:hypothetical protein
VASVPGGNADLEITVAGGAAQPPVVLPNRSLEYFNYAVGTALVLDGGYGWNGGGSVLTPFARRVGEEQFETYAVGGVTGPAMTGGTGWNGSPVIAAY